MNQRRGLLTILLLVACSNEVQTIEQLDKVEIVTNPTSSTSSTSSSTTTTTTTIVNIEPQLTISCEPYESLEGYLSFNFQITAGSSELEVLNIVSWLDHQRHDDFYIYNDLPNPYGYDEFAFHTDNNASVYEIEMVVMDKNENFVSTYCLYEQ